MFCDKWLLTLTNSKDFCPALGAGPLQGGLLILQGDVFMIFYIYLGSALKAVSFVLLSHFGSLLLVSLNYPLSPTIIIRMLSRLKNICDTRDYSVRSL